MAIKCPRCQTENPDTLRFCGECGTQLPASEEISSSLTKTLETPIRRLEMGSIFAKRYEIIEELGTGGMGKVYRVKDEKLDEEMALKVLRPEIAADKGMIKRFKNELKFARKIAHKSVCRMYDLNEEEGTHFITMEYVPGEDLKSYIRKKGKISGEEAISIAKQVCEGLSEAHELGVVHRDLKPQNIMIDEKGRAKIMDFGIARSVEAPGVTQTGVMIGTPDYISPEQAEGEEADQRSDIYSLGVILYEMVTGGVPFKGDTALSVAIKHKTKLPQDPKKINPEVSDNLSRLILVCMEKDRERRYQTAEELLTDLRNIEEGLPLGAKIRPRRETFVVALIRKKLFIPALVVALAIVAVAIWQLLPQKETVPSAPSGKPSLAVVYFENNTGDESLDHWRKALSELLIADLSQSKYLKILPGDRLFEILGKLNQLEAKSYSSDVLKELAARAGMDNILRGSYTKAGDTLRVDIMLQNASTGEHIGSDRAEGKGEESFFSMVDELTPKIKANFQLTAEEIAGDIDRDIGKIATSSPEAYKFFSEGLEYHFKGDWRRAIQFMERAVAADPEFASAYRWMAWAYHNLVYKSAFKENIEKAFELSDRLPERERLQIQGDFYFKSEETFDKAIVAYEKYLELYPDDWLINLQLGSVYSQLEEWDKAIEQYKVGVENKVDAHFPYGNLATMCQAKGLYDESREVLEYYLNNISDHSMMRYFMAENYIFQGKYELALSEVDKAFSIDPDIYYSSFVKGYVNQCKGDLIQAEKEFSKLKIKKEVIANIWVKEALGALYLLQGKLEKSIDQVKQGISLAETVEAKQEESIFHLYLAKLYIKSGNSEEALIECKKALNRAVQAEYLDLQRIALYYKGIAYLKMKSMDSAEKTAFELKEFIEKGLNSKALRFYYCLMGQIEIEREGFSRAIDFLEQALSLSPSPSIKDLSFLLKHISLFIDPLAFAYYRAGDLENSHKEYEKITALTSSSICYEGDAYAKSFYMLGKIYEQIGNKAKAIEHYSKFLSLWKEADPGIPEVEDAKKRLAGSKVP